MNETLAALSALASVLAVVITATLTYRLHRVSRREAAEDLATRFREPLLQATHNLQSRMFNIARKDFLGRFLVADGATERERAYAVRNTVYLFGQYLGWVEVIRREAQYVDPRRRGTNRLIVERLEAVRDCLAASERADDRALRLFRGEQRAVGEVMLVPTDSARNTPRWECVGYAGFNERLADPAFRRWFTPLEDDVAEIAARGGVPPRVKELQHALVDLMDALDPGCERVARPWRERL